MAEDMIDKRPEVEPTFFAYRPLPDDPDEMQQLCREAAEALHRGDGATFFRFTLINNHYPQPPYPHGLYVEGWRIDPALMDPSGRQAPFNFPLVAVDPSTPPT